MARNKSVPAWIAALIISVSACGTNLSDMWRFVKIKTARGEVCFEVTCAVTPAEQAKGLMHRSFLAKSAGMLFCFDSEALRSFWMKNTLIPLDIIFISAQGAIVNIVENARPMSEESVKSGAPAQYVLEINGGLCQAFGIAVGDQVIPY